MYQCAGTRFVSGKHSAQSQTGYWSLVDPDMLPFDFEQNGIKKKVAFRVQVGGQLVSCAVADDGKKEKKRKVPATEEPEKTTDGSPVIKNSPALTPGGSSAPQKKKSKSSAAATGSENPVVVTSKPEPKPTSSSTSAPAPRRKKRDTVTDTNRPSIELYLDLPNPKERIRISRQPTHSAPQFQVTDHGTVAFNEKGYRMAKATHGVSAGTWYYEITILEPEKADPKANLRIGWSQIR